MSRKQLMPKLRFSDFSHTPFHKVKLGDITSYFKGFAFKSEDYQTSGSDDLRIVRVSDLSSNAIKLSNEKIYFLASKSESVNKYRIKSGDIIVTTVGSRPDLKESAVGRGIYIDSNSNGFLNQNLLVLRAQISNVNQFIAAQINTNRYIDYIKNIQRGNANQANITVADLLEYPIAITSEKEQQKIADFLTAVDTKISQLTEKHRLLKEYKKGVMQQLFSQQIRFKDNDDKAFPEWEEYTLIELSDGGISNGVFNDPQKVGQGYRLINVKDMYIGDSIDCTKLTLLELDQKQFVKNQVKFGDIFFTRSSIVPSGIAFSNVNLSHDEDITYDGHLMKLSPKLELVTPQFLAYYLRSYTLRKILVSRGKQSTMTTIAQDDIKDIELSLPCLTEQQKIAQFLQSIDKKIDAVAEQVAQTKQFKKGLLQQMFV